MNKKAICLILAIITAVFACGCKGYRETDNCYIVTALGFDGGKKIKVLAEIVTAGGSERSNEPYSEVLSGEGNTPEEAVFSLNSQISKMLMFDHCTAVILGSSLKSEQINDVINYGRDLKELSFAAYMLVCDSAEKLLKDSDSVSVARGFDIAGNIRETKKDTGIDYNNRFFEVFEAYKGGKYFALPVFSTEDKKIIIIGQRIFKRKKEIATLDNEESLVYSFLENHNTGGKIFMEKEYAQVTQSDFKLDNNRYKATLHIKNNTSDFEEIFKKNTEKFLKKHEGKFGIKSDKVSLTVREGV